MITKTTAVVLTLATVTACAPNPDRADPTGRTSLTDLTVQTPGSMAGYNRDRFPHWITVSGRCDTRKTVLNRDGTGVITGPDCHPTTGSWYSPYDGATWTNPSDVDIDHIVPLAEAWRSGADSWTTAQRRDFANDLTRPQLIAVTDNVNQAKGDKDPAAWKPPLVGYHCRYARDWVAVKRHWGLSVDPAERDALVEMLNTCTR